MSSSEKTLLFLPGATGDGAFWSGVGNLLPTSWRKQYLSWPGLGTQPISSAIAGWSDLLALAEEALTAPTAIVAQSMGGIIATQLALKYPTLVTHLVLVATSGGLDVSAFGAEDWRPDFVSAFPDTPSWLLNEKPDLTGRFADLDMPTLLIWGDRDPISPIAVGRHLASLIPRSRLAIVSGGQHGMAKEQPESVAPLIEAHISRAL